MKRFVYQNDTFEVINYETSKGKQLSARCENYKGFRLWDIYGRYSETKAHIWEYWYNQYCNDSKSSQWGIVSYNAQFFSVGWFTTLTKPVDKGFSKDVAILVTPGHNYMIVYPE